MLQKYKLIIFDCDGTLVDSERLANKLISDMMNELGIEMDEQKSLELFKGTHFKKITDYIEQMSDYSSGLDFEKEYRERCKTLFEEHLTEVLGVSDFIKNLSMDYCVASNGPRVKMKTSLSVTGLDKLIPSSNIFSAYDINSFKPEPKLFQHAADTLGFSYNDCLVIEDTIPGIEAAKNAGMDVWAILHPGINDEILEFDIPIFNNFNEINI